MTRRNIEPTHMLDDCIPGLSLGETALQRRLLVGGGTEDRVMDEVARLDAEA
jgi:hypothetical protein